MTDVGKPEWLPRTVKEMENMIRVGAALRQLRPGQIVPSGAADRRRNCSSVRRRFKQDCQNAERNGEGPSIPDYRICYEAGTSATRQGI